jgi:hypothetical protein
MQTFMNHFINRHVPSPDMLDALVDQTLADKGFKLVTRAGEEITFKTDGTKIYLTAAATPLPGATLLKADIETCSMLLHVVDMLLLPQGVFVQDLPRAPAPAGAFKVPKPASAPPRQRPAKPTKRKRKQPAQPKTPAPKTPANRPPATAVETPPNVERTPTDAEGRAGRDRVMVGGIVGAAALLGLLCTAAIWWVHQTTARKKRSAAVRSSSLVACDTLDMARIVHGVHAWRPMLTQSCTLQGELEKMQGQRLSGGSSLPAGSVHATGSAMNRHTSKGHNDGVPQTNEAGQAEVSVSNTKQELAAAASHVPPVRSSATSVHRSGDMSPFLAAQSTSFAMQSPSWAACSMMDGSERPTVGGWSPPAPQALNPCLRRHVRTCTDCYAAWHVRPCIFCLLFCQCSGLQASSLQVHLLADRPRGRGTAALDTLDGYITTTVLPTRPDAQAPCSVQKDYLNKQLDSLIGHEVLDVLRVLGGHRSRLQGGVLQLLPELYQIEISQSDVCRCRSGVFQGCRTN